MSKPIAVSFDNDVRGFGFIVCGEMVQVIRVAAHLLNKVCLFKRCLEVVVVDLQLETRCTTNIRTVGRCQRRPRHLTRASSAYHVGHF